MDTSKRLVYSGFEEYYMTGAEIKYYFRNSYLCFGGHHSQTRSYKINFYTDFPKIKEMTKYRLFISDAFCAIFDIEAAKKIYFFCYTNEKPEWAKD